MAQGVRERALDRMAAMPAWIVWSIALPLLAGVALLDWFSQAEVAAGLLYLLPVSYVAWCRGRRAAIGMALLAGATWLSIDLATHWHDLSTGLEVINATVLFTVFVLFAQLLATLQRRLVRERTLAHTDSLTQLHNRRALWNATARELERCRRDAQPFSVAYVDVDRFKGVNDRFGHAAGDQLLIDIARELQRDLRQLDMVARIGGDEFALLLPGTDEPGAAAVLARLRDRLQRTGWRATYGIDLSFGCLTVLRAPPDVDAVIRLADQLMYATKRSGSGLLRHEVLGGAGAAAAGAETRSAEPGAAT